MDECSVKAGFSKNSDAVVDEVTDFVREVVEAVAYNMKLEKILSIRGNRSFAHHVLAPKLGDGSSDPENAEKGEFYQKPRKRRRRREAKEDREAFLAEKKQKRVEMQREKERIKREQMEAKEKKRAEERQRKEQKRKEEEERRERRRVQEEYRRQRRENDEKERERRKKEEEERRVRRKKEEEVMEMKKKRESDRFLAFFAKKEKSEKMESPVTSSSVLNILPFYCKQGVSLAPQFRREPLSQEVHDNLLKLSPSENSYLSTIKPRKIGKGKLNRAKLFQFHDNWRPPYYGTWRKRSTVVTGRKPFAKDTKILNYDVDSDDEWEIPEGDDCDQSSMSDEEEARSTDNDGFLVEHGYLSEGEGEDEEDRVERNEDPSDRAKRLKAVAKNWALSLEQKTKKFTKPLVPVLYGPCFESPDEGAPLEVKLAKAVFFKYSDEDQGDSSNSDGNSDDDIVILE